MPSKILTGDKVIDAVVSAADEQFEADYKAWCDENPGYVGKTPETRKLLKGFFYMFYLKGARVGLESALAFEVAEKLGL
jgi:hypothetical protein